MKQIIEPVQLTFCPVLFFLAEFGTDSREISGSRINSFSWLLGVGNLAYYVAYIHIMKWVFILVPLNIYCRLWCLSAIKTHYLVWVSFVGIMFFASSNYDGFFNKYLCQDYQSTFASGVANWLFWTHAIVFTNSFQIMLLLCTKDINLDRTKRDSCISFSSLHSSMFKITFGISSNTGTELIVSIYKEDQLCTNIKFTS